MLNKSIPEMLEDAKRIEAAMKLPGIPAAEMNIYQTTLNTIYAEIKRRNANASASDETRTAAPLTVKVVNAGGHTRRPAQVKMGHEISMEASAETMLFYRKNPTIGLDFSEGEKIEVAHQPGAASLEIVWQDGYTLKVTESEAVSRFKTTFRDTCALRCVKHGRYDAMWRWDTPWRCAGFLSAISKFWGQEPTLFQLGIKWPTEINNTVFAVIKNKFKQG